jgi:dihydrofolate synthase/folylpolyglutamate synthase
MNDYEDMSFLVSVSFFFSLGIAFVAFARFRISEASLDSYYKEVMKQLFEISVKPQRHSNTEFSTESIFQQRKVFFKKIYESSGLRKSCQVIHVAGSKGKGSTVEYIATGLISQGFAVGIFTSPHLHTACERIKINRELITKKDFVRLGRKSLVLLATESWTVFFDSLLLMAILYFGEKRVDYIILETGIGGRYDSTNFLDTVEASVITNISLDHQALLGDSIEQIASQKAGIIKAGCPVFTSSKQESSVIEVLQDEAQRKQSNISIIDIDR